jgi:LytS/YehU family sensor histidine kinase
MAPLIRKDPPSWLERHQQLRQTEAMINSQSKLHAKRHTVKRQTLHLHLSPHFMFNALSSVQWLAAQGEWPKAQATLASFTHLWNKHWSVHQQPVHSLEEELASMRQCTVLESVRLGRPVKWSIEVSETVFTDCELPALLLQPALENAMWHGLAHSKVAPKLHIDIRPVNDWPHGVEIRVLDNGVGLPSKHIVPTPSRHGAASVGLDLVRQKLAMVHPEASFHLAPASPPWSTAAVFKLPLSPPEA